MALSDSSLATTAEADLRRIVQQPAAHPAELVAAAQQELLRRQAPAPDPTLAADFNSYEAEQPSRLGPILLAIVALGLLLGGFWWYKQRPTAPAEPVAKRATSPDSLKLETVVAAPLPKFDVEAPILRQLGLLPPAERTTAGLPMRQYQSLTRRFWLAQYSTEYLLKQAENGPPNLTVFAQQLATTQSHWRVLREGLSQYGPFPPGMAAHLARFKTIERYQQAALSELQADCASQRPPHLDEAANLAARKEVQQTLAPLLREPAPLKVRLQ